MNTITLTEDQLSAIQCAIADLQGAIQYAESNDPMVEFDTQAAHDSIQDLLKAFPMRQLTDWYTPL